MTAENFQSGDAYLTPAFRIELDGRDAGREVISDVLEVSFTDDLGAVDNCEFVLHDWDPVALRPRYSSPWDESGQAFTLYEGGPEVPNFEPGAQVSLYLGYLENGDLPLIMEGEVVSLAPTFPRAGHPLVGSAPWTPSSAVCRRCGSRATTTGPRRRSSIRSAPRTT